MEPNPVPGSPGALAAAQDLARSVMVTQAAAAELRVIAYDIRLRAHAEYRRARLLAMGAEAVPATQAPPLVL